MNLFHFMRFEAEIKRQIAGADSREIDAWKGGREKVKETVEDDEGIGKVLGK